MGCLGDYKSTKSILNVLNNNDFIEKANLMLIIVSFEP